MSELDIYLCLKKAEDVDQSKDLGGQDEFQEDEDVEVKKGDAIHLQS